MFSSRTSLGRGAVLACIVSTWACAGNDADLPLDQGQAGLPDQGQAGAGPGQAGTAGDTEFTTSLERTYESEQNPSGGGGAGGTGGGTPTTPTTPTTDEPDDGADPSRAIA